MDIKNSEISDINEIFRLYKIATDFQKTKYESHWPEFDKGLVEKEIEEKKQWKLIRDNQTACIWATTFSDPQIWGERDSDPSLYLHRIVTNPDFRGQGLVEEIVKWSKEHAKKHRKKFVRMDTVGNNTGLIQYYQRCGFDFLGLSVLKDTAGLPAHYHKATVSLFQLPIA